MSESDLHTSGSRRQQTPPPVTLNSSQVNLLQLGDVTIPLQDRSPPRNLTPISPTVGDGRGRSQERGLMPQSPVTPRFSPTESNELLLPPSANPGRFRAYSDSPGSSRRSSWSSDFRSDFHSNLGPYGYDPFSDSRSGTPDRFNSSDNLTSQEKYNISPNAHMYDGPEEDDALHDASIPDESECDIFTKRGLINVGGLALIIIGLLALFIGYPVLTFVRDIVEPEPGCEGPMCLEVGDVPLLKNARHQLIDPDTPKSAMTKKSWRGEDYKLVFSDEFNRPNRTFYPGDDPFWEGVDIHYAATQDLEWYDPDQMTTKDGVLEITFAKFKNHDLDFRSGMLQSWNKLCFKGGIIEASISLPGEGDISGLWGSFWTMGNLGRPGYLASTEGMWPYSYHDGCDAGITANQSSSDGLSFLPGMKLPGCTCEGEDHPTPGRARSAPEIDAIEASVGVIDDKTGERAGVASQSAQVAPFDIWYQPNYDHVAVYHPEFTTMNSYRGGFFQEAISGLTVLNNDWYNGKAYQTYGFEYEPGADGMVEFFVGDLKMWRMNAAATGPNGNVGMRPIPMEPMTVILNVGMSPTFAAIDFDLLDKILPTKMRVDYLRIYQKAGEESVTCDPPGYETTKYIEDHIDVFMNPNLTLWKNTGYSWPKNSYVDGCKEAKKVK